MASRPRWRGELDGRRWAYRSATLRGLSFRFAVRCTDSSLGRAVDALVEPLRTPVPAAHLYSLVTSRSGYTHLFLDDSFVAHTEDVASAIAWLSWDINRAVAEESTSYLLMHSGAVAVPGGGEGGVLLPGAAGSGKSTLVAALVRAGLGYLSDELVALDLPGAALVPFPRTIVLKKGSFELLGDLRPWSVDASGPLRTAIATEEDPGVEPAHSGGDEVRYLRPNDIRASAVGTRCAPGIVVLPRYSPGGSSRPRRLAPSEAFLRLVTNAINLGRHGCVGARVLADLVERCDCYELEMDDLDAACSSIMALVGI
jgi:hypothetical protein